MHDSSYKDIARDANFVLSIVPPSDAFTFAESFIAQAASGHKEGLVFVDCNAVNPETVKRISVLFQAKSAAGMRFVDAGIIGGPPKAEYDPTFYASADDDKALSAFEQLGKHGLKIKTLRGEG